MTLRIRGPFVEAGGQGFSARKRRKGADSADFLRPNNFEAQNAAFLRQPRDAVSRDLCHCTLPHLSCGPVRQTVNRSYQSHRQKAFFRLLSTSSLHKDRCRVWRMQLAQNTKAAFDSSNGSLTHAPLGSQSVLIQRLSTLPLVTCALGHDMEACPADRECGYQKIIFTLSRGRRR
jgi:hypothetical protein